MGRPEESLIRKTLIDAVAQGPYRTGALISLLRLHWFIRLRWTIIAASLVALTAERFLVPTVQRPPQLAIVLVVLAITNIGWMFVSSRLSRTRGDGRHDSEADVIRASLIFANAQVATDLLLLTLILRYTGGVENPMAAFYLFHMAISALVLRSWQAAVQGVWAVLLYLSMGVGELSGVITPHFSLLPSMRGMGLYLIPEYVVVACASIGCGVLGMLYFTQRIAVRLDAKEQELRQAMDALRRSQEAITDLQQRRSRFMHTAAHQLKAPLAVIQTMAGLIRDGIVTDVAARDTCRKIIFRCQEGISQVTELLTLARLQETDPCKRPHTVCDARQIVQSMCEKHRPLAEDKNLVMDVDVAKDVDLCVEVDARDLSDCVGNLIENAIKYTFAPGQVSVVVGRGSPGGLPENAVYDASKSTSGDGRAADDWVFISVSDTGMGIDPDQLDVRGSKGTLFDSFRRGAPALEASIPGTGLGLSIVREVVEIAGGRIYVRSSIGKGSTFAIVLPAQGARDGTLLVRDTRSSEVVADSGELPIKRP